MSFSCSPKHSPHSLVCGWVPPPVGCVLIGHLVWMRPSLALRLAIPHVPRLSEVSMSCPSAATSSPTPASPAVVRLPQRGLRLGCAEKEKANKGSKAMDLKYTLTCTPTLTQLNLMLG